MTTMTWPGRTAAPASARTAITRPGIGADRTDAPVDARRRGVPHDSTVGGGATAELDALPVDVDVDGRSVPDGRGDRIDAGPSTADARSSSPWRRRRMAGR